MPEGHTIHRLAAELSRDFGGQIATVSSPQGRFAEGAALLHGERFDRAEAFGKHLFLRWELGDTVHIHLGLIGKFRSTDAAVAPGDTIRLRLEHQDRAWHLTGPQTCAVIEPTREAEIIAALGPDPLRRGTKRTDAFVAGLGGTSRAIGAVLLDQRIIAGIGNVYRAELLFLQGIHPARAAKELTHAEAAQLWETTCAQLKRGKAWNRIVTVTPEDAPTRVMRKMASEDALYVYKRQGLPCRRCATPIEIAAIAGRSIWSCPACQPR